LAPAGLLPQKLYFCSLIPSSTLHFPTFLYMIALEDFFRNAESSSYRLSPDGHYLAYLAPYCDRMNLFVRSIAADGQLGAPIRLTSETDRSLGGYLWADNERLIYAKDEGGDENYHLFGIRRDGSDERAYTNFPGVRAGIIDDLPEVPGQILIEMNRRNPEAFDPYRLDLDTGELTLLAENPGNYQGWTTDHEGRLRVVYAIVDGVNTQILYRDHEEEDFRPVLTTNFRENVCYSLFTPDNKMVWGVSNRGRDKNALVLIDPATAEEREVLFEHERYDVDALTYSRKRRCLLGAFCAGHREPVRHYFDETAREQRARLEKHFPGRQIGLVDTDRDEVRCIVLVAGDRTRGAYYFYDRESDHTELLAEVAPWLPESEMVPIHPVTFTTRDGLLIEAYLSLPPGVELNAIDTPLPVIVNPHGGPWTRDDWGFSSEVQFLCSRGYAVFQLNFRGSTGYGREFLEKSYKQWGLAMQDDITDGVHWLIDSGIADPKRIAIYGASYGGYATLAGACFTPDLYCCAIDYVGVSNLLTFLQTIPPYWRSMLEMMYEQVGHPERDRAQLEATSPALHADAIRCPLFIAQGANDPRVNKDESDQMVAALRSRGVEVEYMVKDNEGHGFANQENRFDFYRAVERFLQTHV
jgi:peptidase S9